MRHVPRTDRLVVTDVTCPKFNDLLVKHGGRILARANARVKTYRENDPAAAIALEHAVGKEQVFNAVLLKTVYRRDASPSLGEFAKIPGSNAAVFISYTDFDTAFFKAPLNFLRRDGRFANIGELLFVAFHVLHAAKFQKWNGRTWIDAMYTSSMTADVTSAMADVTTVINSGKLGTVIVQPTGGHLWSWLPNDNNPNNFVTLDDAYVTNFPRQLSHDDAPSDTQQRQPLHDAVDALRKFWNRGQLGALVDSMNDNDSIHVTISIHTHKPNRPSGSHANAIRISRRGGVTFVFVYEPHGHRMGSDWYGAVQRVVKLAIAYHNLVLRLSGIMVFEHNTFCPKVQSGFPLCRIYSIYASVMDTLIQQHLPDVDPAYRSVITEALCMPSLKRPRKPLPRLSEWRQTTNVSRYFSNEIRASSRRMADDRRHGAAPVFLETGIVLATETDPDDPVVMYVDMTCTLDVLLLMMILSSGEPYTGATRTTAGTRTKVTGAPTDDHYASERAAAYETEQAAGTRPHFTVVAEVYNAHSKRAAKRAWTLRTYSDKPVAFVDETGVSGAPDGIADFLTVQWLRDYRGQLYRNNHHAPTEAPNRDMIRLTATPCDKTGGQWPGEKDRVFYVNFPGYV